LNLTFLTGNSLQASQPARRLHNRRASRRVSLPGSRRVNHQVSPHLSLVLNLQVSHLTNLPHSLARSQLANQVQSRRVSPLLNPVRCLRDSLQGYLRCSHQVSPVRVQPCSQLRSRPCSPVDSQLHNLVDSLHHNRLCNRLRSHLQGLQGNRQGSPRDNRPGNHFQDRLGNQQTNLRHVRQGSLQRNRLANRQASLLRGQQCNRRRNQLLNQLSQLDSPLLSLPTQHPSPHHSRRTRLLSPVRSRLRSLLTSRLPSQVQSHLPNRPVNRVPNQQILLRYPLSSPVVNQRLYHLVNQLQFRRASLPLNRALSLRNSQYQHQLQCLPLNQLDCLALSRHRSRVDFPLVSLRAAPVLFQPANRHVFLPRSRQATPPVCHQDSPRVYHQVSLQDSPPLFPRANQAFSHQECLLLPLLLTQHHSQRLFHLFSRVVNPLLFPQATLRSSLLVARHHSLQVNQVHSLQHSRLQRRAGIRRESRLRSLPLRQPSSQRVNQPHQPECRRLSLPLRHRMYRELFLQGVLGQLPHLSQRAIPLASRALFRQRSRHHSRLDFLLNNQVHSRQVGRHQNQQILLPSHQTRPAANRHLNRPESRPLPLQVDDHQLALRCNHQLRLLLNQPVFHLASQVVSPSQGLLRSRHHNHPLLHHSSQWEFHLLSRLNSP